MKAILLTVLAVTAPIGLIATEASVPSALSELGKTLRHAHSLPTGSTLKLDCPEKLGGMKGISKTAVFAERGSPDMEESVQSHGAEPFFLMHCDLCPPRRPSRTSARALSQTPKADIRRSPSN
jgi:hypothetical protein